MSVLYRSVWASGMTSGVDQVFDSIRQCIAAWTQETLKPVALVEGNTELTVSQVRQRSVVYRVLGPDAFEVTVNDRDVVDATDWTTAIRIVSVENYVHTFVENSIESDDLLRRVSIGRPRIVHELLRAAEKPILGGSAVLTTLQAIPAEGVGILVSLLADSRRTLPVIVCTESGAEHDESWLVSANKIASRSEGVALVITLDQKATISFKNQIGNLAIWGGGIRVYAPVPVAAESDGWRHRYYLGSRLEQAPQSTIDRIVYSVAQLSVRRRVPKVFGIFGDQGAGTTSASNSMIPAAVLEEARECWEFDRDIALDERSELEKELAAASGHLSRLKEALISQGLTDMLWGTQHVADTSVPDEVQDTSEAVLAAQTYLSKWLALPDCAAQELDDIDAAPPAFAWGNNTWRGLRALAAYAEDRANGWDKGGFWAWCASGPLLGWPATSKKLSMSEGETVQNSEKLSRTRIFKVDCDVNGSGEITMLAHLKISEGGGSLAPRVYFHDDTAGATGKVHVGLVGPHYLVPNKSTN